MPAPLSIVIPTLNVAGNIAPCLEAIYPGILEGLIREVIFADGGSTDNTKSIAKDWGVVFVEAESGRGAQLRAGVFVAKAEWVFIVHADTVLSPDWIDGVRQHISFSKSAGYGRLRFDDTGFFPFLYSRWANIRSRIFGLPYGDQTMLVRQELYQQVGGFPDIPLMEDVALARALRGRLQPLGFQAVTSAAKYRQHGWLKQGLRNLRFLLRFLFGADPKKLAQEY